ncbi:MAG TPA: glycosyltransferase [Nocardioidaceae bacterium]|nr:glycosyltransferase [Nocardioidaceae bacterium]
MPAPKPLSVAVLLELERSPRSGGHVKCWERFAHAATGVADIDLTVYVLGRHRGVDRVADNVRFVTLRPIVPTGGVNRIVGGVDASDLAPYHPALARELPQHDIWHLTHSLAFAATAVRVRGSRRRPMVASVHTDVPTLSQIYTRQVVDRMPAAPRMVVRRTKADQVPRALAQRRRDRVLRACDCVLVSNADDHDDVARAAPGVPISGLRRGIDTSMFRPGLADRGWLSRKYGVPADRPTVLFVGRVDATKGVPLVAEAVHRLHVSGHGVHLVVAGDGAETGRLSKLLHRNVTLLGSLPQAELARVYASCDLLAFPSCSETAGNVVAEAMAAGLPVVLPDGAATTQWLAEPGHDGMLVDHDSPEAWAAALARLLTDTDHRQAMGRRARATSRARHASWLDVLHEDLLPVWRDVHKRSAAARSVATA